MVSVDVVLLRQNDKNGTCFAMEMKVLCQYAEECSWETLMSLKLELAVSAIAGKMEWKGFFGSIVKFFAEPSCY